MYSNYDFCWQIWLKSLLSFADNIDSISYVDEEYNDYDEKEEYEVSYTIRFIVENTLDDVSNKKLSEINNF